MGESIVLRNEKAKGSPRDDLDGAQNIAGIAALAAAVLAFGKLGLFWWTGSLVVGTSAWDSSLDVVISLINRKIVRFARQTADSEHPYGHGKAESIASLGQGALITGGAFAILWGSVDRFLELASGQAVPTSLGWGVVGFFVVAALCSAGVARLLRHGGKRYRSSALLADAQHYQADVVSNLGSAASLALVMLTGREILDPIFAVLLASIIAYSGFRLLKSSTDELMDHDVSEEVKRKAWDIVAGIDGRIVDIHRFRGRRSGHKLFFDFHLTLPANMEFSEVHAIVEKVEHTLQHELDADVLVHADPADIVSTSEKT